MKFLGPTYPDGSTLDDSIVVEITESSRAQPNRLPPGLSQGVEYTRRQLVLAAARLAAKLVIRIDLVSSCILNRFGAHFLTSADALRSQRLPSAAPTIVKIGLRSTGR